MDKLVINDIKLTTLVGVHGWEQHCPQNLRLDISFQTDVNAIAQHDRLETAIDYDKVLQHLMQFAQQNHFQLIETLAERIAQELLTHFPTTWVQISLHKPGALKQAKGVTIMIERNK